jgi:hypothetical protein
MKQHGGARLESIPERLHRNCGRARARAHLRIHQVDPAAVVRSTIQVREGIHQKVFFADFAATRAANAQRFSRGAVAHTILTSVETLTAARTPVAGHTSRPYLQRKR